MFYVLSGSRFCSKRPLCLQGAVAFTFGLVESLVLSYSIWQLYINACIVTTLTAKSVDILNVETADSHGELHIKI